MAWGTIAIIILFVLLAIFLRFMTVSVMHEYKNKVDCLEKRVDMLQNDIDGLKLENAFLKRKGGVDHGTKK